MSRSCKGFDGFNLIEVGGMVERGVAFIVLLVGVGARVTQQLYALGEAKVGRTVERCEVVEVTLHINFRSLLQQLLCGTVMLGLRTIVNLLWFCLTMY